MKTLLHPCSLKTFCPHPGAGCDAKEASWCPEAEEIKNILKDPCPVMVEAGYDPEKSISRCTLPQLRLACLKEGLCCNPNGECIIKNLSPSEREIIMRGSDSIGDTPMILSRKDIKKIEPAVKLQATIHNH